MMCANNLFQDLSVGKINHAVKNVLNNPLYEKLRFAKVETSAEWQAVKEFRLVSYDKSLKYMLNELGKDGSDSFDKHSFIFAVWYEGRVIASIRLTPFPFETMNFIRAAELNAFLGNNWKYHYLEWSRLIVDTSLRINNLMQALTVFAGLTILATTHYTKYFGYTKPWVRRILSCFQVENEKLQFSIPNRGDHVYYLLKGSFVNDFNKLNNY